MGALTSRDKYLRKTYAITEREYKRLAGKYKGGCWVCRKPPKEGKNLAVDHDHRLEKAVGVRKSIRGVLCFRCNKRVIGRQRREHSYLYANAAEYLTSDDAQRLLEAA